MQFFPRDYAGLPAKDKVPLSPNQRMKMKLPITVTCLLMLALWADYNECVAKLGERQCQLSYSACHEGLLVA